MSVVSFVSSKGGSGKTTAAFLLADRALNAGLSVTLIDTDANQPWATFLARCADFPEKLTIVNEADPDKIFDVISEASERSALVIIDSEGTLNRAALVAARCSDLVLIPVQASKLDFDEAIKTLNGLINPDEEFSDLAISYSKIRFFWTKVSTAIITIVEKRCIQEAEKASLTFLNTKITDRAAYGAVFYFSKMLDQLNAENASGVAVASELAGNFMMEILGVLTLLRGQAKTGEGKK